MHDLFIANYGVDQGWGGPNVASGFDDDMPYTPAWAEIRRDNEASWRSAVKAGWVRLESANQALVIVRTPNPCVCGHGYLEHSGTDAWCDACDDEHAYAEAQ